MENSDNLEEMCAEIHSNTLETLYLVEILSDMSGAEPKEIALLDIITKKLKKNFATMSQCRKIISPAD